MRKHWLSIVSLAAFFALAAAYFTAAHVSARAGEGSPLFSIRRHDPYGTAALFELLEKRGAEVSTLERSLPPKKFSGTLVRVFPGAGAKDAPGLQAKPMLEWVKNGGRLVVFTPEPDDLLELAFALTQPEKKTDDKKAESKKADDKTIPKIFTLSALSGSAAPAWDANLLDAMAHGEHPDRLLPEPTALAWETGAETLLNLRPLPDRLTLAAPMALPKVFPNWTVLAYSQKTGWEGAKKNEQTTPVVGRLAVGKGEIIVVGDPMPVSNIGLRRAGNLRLALALLDKRGPILFDEFSHGLGASDRLLALITRFGLLPVLLQGLFTGALFIWSTWGSPRPPMQDPPLRPRPASDQVLALGHLLAQSSNPAQLLARVPRLVRRRFCAALGVPPESLARTLEKHGAGARAQALLARADALTGVLSSHAEAQAAAILRESHLLAKELAHEHAPRR